MATRLPDPNHHRRRRGIAKLGSWLERALHLLASGQTVGPSIWVIVLAVTASLLSLWRQLAWPWRVLLFVSAVFLIVSLTATLARVISLRRRAASGEAIPPPNQVGFAFFLQQGAGIINASDNLMTVENTGSAEPAPPRLSTLEERQALSRKLLTLSRELTRMLDEHDEMRDRGLELHQREVDKLYTERRREGDATADEERDIERYPDPYDLSRILREGTRQIMSRYRSDFDRHVARLYEDARAIGYRDERLEMLYRYPHVQQLREMAQRLGVLSERLNSDR
jgi:hypothetical protein